MVSLALEVFLHFAKNDSKCRDVAPLKRIANDELENFRLNFSRCPNRDVAPLN